MVSMWPGGQYQHPSVEGVADTIKSRHEAQQLVKKSLRKAHKRMKLYVDKKRVERSFQVGDYVYLKLNPSR